MNEISRRLKKDEKALNVHEEKKVAEVIVFCDLKSPREYTSGNTIIREVSYSDICKRNNWPCETFTDEKTQ